MKKKPDPSSYFRRTGMAGGVLPLLITSIAIILFSTAGIARVLGWSSMAIWESGDSLALALDRTAPVTTLASRSRLKCPDCGEIVSMREFTSHDKDAGPGAAGAVMADNPEETHVKPIRRYEIIVRISDGSTRVIDQANPARWRTGERLIVIAGTNPSTP